MALLRVEGYLDVDTATEFQHHLANQLHHGRRHFLLDLSAVPFMDSSGMNIILRVYQEARELPGSVHIIDPTPAVRRILDLTGVSITVPVSATVEDALALVDRGRKRGSRRRTDRTAVPRLAHEWVPPPASAPLGAFARPGLGVVRGRRVVTVVARQSHTVRSVRAVRATRGDEE